MKYNIKLKNLLSKYHKGAIGFEGVISMPVIFTLFMLSLMFLMTMMTYISYNNAANTLAQDLNMRASGYRKTLGSAVNYHYLGDEHHNINGNETHLGSETSISANYDGSPTTTTDNVLLCGLSSAINGMTNNNTNNQLTMPFTAIKYINAQETKAIDLNNGKANIGNNITVTIAYYPISLFQNSNLNGLYVKAKGYTTID